MVVGAGFTGLWTAYYLLVADPSLRVTVLEAETAGFGASGRNGGWCSALFPASASTMAGLPGSSRDAAIAQHQAMRATVDEVLAVAAAEGIDAQAHKGGTIALARTRSPAASRAHAEVDAARAWGRGERRRPVPRRGRGPLAARRHRHARRHLHPGLCGDPSGAAGARPGPCGRAARRASSTSAPGCARSSRTARSPTTAPSRADVVVRATEGYTRTLRGQTRAIVPVYSLIVATEPLADEVWERIGLRERETFTDHRNLIVYGQRTADGRLVFGGRGAPYHFGSSIRPEHDREDAVFASLRATLREMFPVLEQARFTHAWGGALGIPRDWVASVGLDRGDRSGLGRRLRRRRRRHHQPRRPHAARPGARPRDRR